MKKKMKMKMMMPKEYCKHAYTRRYGLLKQSSNNENLGEIVVYTAIFGNYDTLKEPKVISRNVKYICFTNNKNIQSNVWEIRYVEDNSMDNVRAARKIKLLPHRYVGEYDLSIWVDGHLQIRDDLVNYVKLYLKKSSMLCFPHPERDNVYDEAEACLQQKRGEPDLIFRQMNCYTKDGFKDDVGLFATGCIVRKHNMENIILLMEFWWKQLKHFSNRDQISLSYSCWKKDFSPDICDLYIRDNKWLHKTSHNKATRKDSIGEMEYFFPYHLFHSDERIVLYGYGNVGRSFYKQIMKYKYVDCVGIIDSNANNLNISDVVVNPVEDIKGHEFDSVLISVLDREMALEMKRKLVEFGVEKRCVKWDGDTYSQEGFRKFYIEKMVGFQTIEKSFKNPNVNKGQNFGVFELEDFLSNDSRLDLTETVDIAIPIYNAYEYMKKCIKSVLRNTTTSYNLHLVNDGSNDERIHEFLEKLKEESMPQYLVNLYIVEHEKNVGFLKSMNEILASTHHHIVILNSDVEVPPNWLQRLMAPILKERNIASVTPTTNAASLCSFPKFGKNNKLFDGKNLEFIDKAFSILSAESTIDLPVGVGFCMAMNRHALNQIGIFDTIFGLGYGEEAQWCLRAASLGWRNVWCLNLFVYHKHGMSFAERLDNEKLIEKKRESKDIVRKQYPFYDNTLYKFYTEKEWMNRYVWITSMLRSWSSPKEVNVYVGFSPYKSDGEYFIVMKILRNDHIISWEIYQASEWNEFRFRICSNISIFLKRLFRTYHIKNVFFSDEKMYDIDEACELLCNMID